LKTAGVRHRQPRHFGDHRADAAVLAQPFLAAGEHRFLVLRLDIDHPVRLEPGRGEGRREQVRPGQAPQHPPPGPRRDPGGEKGRRRAVDRPVAAAGHLVQRPERQPAVRQPVIDLWHAERQRCAPPPRTAVKALKTLAKRVEDGRGGAGAHVLIQFTLYDLVLYLFMSRFEVNQHRHTKREASPERRRRTFRIEPRGPSVTRDSKIGVYETMRARGWSKVKLAACLISVTVRRCGSSMLRWQR
jgi:hypothetical protein